MAISPSVEWGRFYSGEREQYGLTLNYRAAPGQMFTLESELNRVALAEGEFYTRLYRLVVETQFNPRAAVTNNVQYDSQSAVIGWQDRSFRVWPRTA